ncbi:FecR domain-containing protein [Comamonas sp. C24C]
MNAEPSHSDLEQAANWYACLRDGTASAKERDAWRRWLESADSHAAAWQYVEDISRAFEPIRTLPNPRVTADQLSTADQRLRTRRLILTGLSILSSGGVVGALSWHQAWLPPQIMAWGADHRTATGQLRQLTLADGSLLWLNTASAVDIQFNAQERRVVLIAGEVFVETAKDSRPLLVQTTHGQMRALGTRFDVLMTDRQTQLAVYQGAVEVRTSATDARRIIPTGQQTTFDAHSIDPLEAGDSAREAWTQGSLVVENLPLREVVQELRRYRRGHLGVADSVADLAVYGNFPLHDTDRVLHMLAATLPIRIEQPFAWWTTIDAQR